MSIKTSIVYEACRSGDIEQVRSLFVNGADIEESCNLFKWTPLQIASFYGHIGTVKLLVNLGANIETLGVNIETKTLCNCTPLYSASIRGHIDVVKLLINLGADFEASDCGGRTAKDVACNSATRAVFKCYAHITELKEWRPWNHSKYPIEYQAAMRTLVILAKAY